MMTYLQMIGWSTLTCSFNLIQFVITLNFIVTLLCTVKLLNETLKQNQKD